MELFCSFLLSFSLALPEMPQQPLPLECVLIILGVLSEEYDTDTMARLLCVNRTICTATLPFLYGDCFNTNMHKHRPRSKKSTLTVVSQLIRTLLWRIHPKDRIPTLLQIAYLSPDDQVTLQSTAEQPAPIFKYGHFIRKLVLHHDPIIYSFGFPSNPRVVDHVTTHQLYDEYVAEGLISSTFNEHNADALENALEMDIHRQLTWALCQECMERIEQLVIPLTDIERYIDHVDQFESLSTVIFTIKKRIPVTERHIGQEDQEERQRELEVERGRLFRAMVRFVERHTSIHRHVLRQVVVPKSCNHLGTNRQSNDDIKLEIFSLLPPLQNPRSINNQNWSELVVQLSDTNLNYVTSIKLVTFAGTISAEKTLLLLDNRPLLSRCRALKQLEMTTLGTDMFQWAVLEKQKNVEHQQQSIIGRQLCSWQHGYYNDLVPLRSVKITHMTPLKPVQELDDLAFAFSDSLEELTVRNKWASGMSAFNHLGSTPQVVHGHGWTLPRLRVLDFKVYGSQLSFDTDALQRSGALNSLCLKDRISTYNHRDIRSWPTVHLPHLKNLNLSGSAALFFNLDSLHHSPCLVNLSLGMPSLNRGCYIPSPKEMGEDPETQGLQDATMDDHGLSETQGLSRGYQSIGTKPRFTWDWHLPNLLKLDLKAVFAYKFDFQWLQHLPNLQFLQLNTSSTQEGLHKRSITLKDLPRGHQQQQGEDDAQVISLPKLEAINLKGHWNIDTKALEVLCLVVAPNLREVDFGASFPGHSVCEWVALSRRMLRIEQSHSVRPLKFGVLKELGLVSLCELPVEDRDKSFVKHNINGEAYYDVQVPWYM
ncbi:MAG: hypothetical protein J3Q66DRAFT_367301 [Benniella sp.]|nr:MAG: hypothetical protein J3Q66DRAFT_367301 [Benniella sp.]